MRRLPTTHLGILAMVALWAAPVWGQGLLIVVNTKDAVPLPRPVVRPEVRPPMAYRIKELAVNARLLDQVARVQVSQSFVNTGSQQMEVSFVFPLPYDGAIDQMTFLVDGKEYPAKLLKADEARKIYEGYVRRNRDPALLEWIGTGMFQTSVFPVPPGAERKVTLHYNQLLRKDHQLTDFLFPLGTAKYTSDPVEKLQIEVSIESTAEIKSVYSPTHAVEVKRPAADRAQVSFTAKEQIPLSDFRLFYDVAPGKLGASVISYRPDVGDDGYLLLLASPEIKPAGAEKARKTVVCVFDRSGSMSGKKIEQAKEAMKFVLNNLREGDLFNIVVYDSEVEAFQPELQRYNDKTREQAMGFVEGLYAGGSTNIHAALTKTLAMLNDTSQPNYVIFMTDGLPTSGETSEAKIVEAVAAANEVHARLLSFGVGYDVNSRLLDRLSRGNFGRSEYVRPDENIETHIARLAGRISSPVMTDVAVKFEFDSMPAAEGDPVNRLYPRQVGDLFEGEQLVVGRYKKAGVAKVKIAGKVGGAEQKFDFPATLIEKSPDQSYAFVEKLWAMRRIGEIIDELDLRGKNDELVKELVELSTKHGILTPYTSFLSDDTASLGDLAGGDAGLKKADAMVERLREAEGKPGVAQRDEKRQLLEAQQALPAMTVPGRGGGLSGASVLDIDKDARVPVDAVQVVGNSVLYRRGNVWYSYDVAKQGQAEVAKKVKVIERFSDEYFKLVEQASPDTARILSQQKPGEEVVVPSASPSEVYHVK